MVTDKESSPDDDDHHQQHQKSLEITKDDKFFSRLLSKETNPSFRVYYGRLGGRVPFIWESEPGTPKHTLSQTTLPPLTPPPSYYAFNNSEITKSPMVNKKKKKLYSRSSYINLLHFLFPKTNKSSIVSSSSWKYQRPQGRRRVLTSRGSSFDSRVDYDDDEDEDPAVGSPALSLCFCIGK